MIKTSKNSRTHKSAINADEMSLIVSHIMEKCDTIEAKLDMLIAKQDAKLCQCDDEKEIPYLKRKEHFDSLL